MIRIGIAEDQTLVRESLAIVLGLEPDFTVAWAVPAGAEAVAEMEQQPVDVLLTDLRMPMLDGVATTKQIKDHHPDVCVIILTTFHHDEWLLDALRAGAQACLLKDVPPLLLASAIRQIHSGTWEPSAWSKEWRMYAPDLQFTARGNGRSSGHLDTLTAREVELIRLICLGGSNADIARTLYLSEGTVKNYISNLYAKLGVRNRQEAVRYARERGMA